MSKAYDEKIAALDALRAAADRTAAVEPLRKALRGRSSYIAGKAATVAAELELGELIPEMIGAFDRYLENGAKSDPQCWAKNAIAKALRKLNCDDASVFRRGAAHFQPEPVWGGQQDTAAALRANCAFALVEMGGLNPLEVLEVLVNLLADPEKPARIDGARAVAQLGRPEGALLLRLRILCGDRDPEVIGHCFIALLSLSPDQGLEVVASFLRSEDPDLRAEAAAALGESRDPRAIGLLTKAWNEEADPELKRTILVSIGASLMPEGTDFLLTLVADAPARVAAMALAALSPNRFREEVAERVAAAVRQRPQPEIKAAWERDFLAGQ